jgi:uncharacterized membrane protein
MMKTENAVLMSQAKESLKGKWGLAIGTVFVYLMIVLGIQLIPIAGIVISLLVSGAFGLGLAHFSLNISRDNSPKFEDIFKGFNNFGTAIGTYLLMLLFIFLWMLLLTIPGIIAALSYSMTFYILADDPSLGPKEALDKSKEMMYGYKMKYFFLSMRFLGWALLCLLTLGIGFLWLMPYMQVSVAKFYDDLKSDVPPVIESSEDSRYSK